MDNVELRTEVIRRLGTVQDKLDYWLMAVAASAIAFAIHQTHGSALRWSLLPLGIAVGTWAVSFFAGCRRQSWIQAGLHTNLGRLRIEGGMDPLAGTNPEKIALGLETLESIFDKQSSKGQCWARVQFRALVVGAVCYLLWHVVEMWITTSA